MSENMSVMTRISSVPSSIFTTTAKPGPLSAGNTAYPNLPSLDGSNSTPLSEPMTQVLSDLQIKELRKRNARLEEENLILKKKRLPYSRLTQTRLDAIHKLRFQQSIKTLCRGLNVNRSTYYRHFNSESGPRVTENQSIKQAILQIDADCDQRAGAYNLKSRDFISMQKPQRPYSHTARAASP